MERTMDPQHTVNYERACALLARWDRVEMVSMFVYCRLESRLGESWPLEVAAVPDADGRGGVTCSMLGR